MVKPEHSFCGAISHNQHNMKHSTLNVSVKQVQLSATVNLAGSSDFHDVDIAKVGAFLYATGRIFVRNRQTSRRSPVVAVLDLNLKRWRWIKYDGYKVEYPKMFLYGDALYMQCLRDWRGVASGTISRFDLILEEWSYANAIGDTPGSRNGFSGDFIEGVDRFVIFGGSRALTTFNDVHLLAMPGCRWVKPKVKGRAPLKRRWHGSCVDEGKIYYYGGSEGTSFRNDGLHILTVLPGDRIIWSSLKTDFFELHAFAFVPYKGKFLLCGGMRHGSRHGITIYSPDSQFVTSPTDVLFAALKPFEIDQRTFGLIGGGNRFGYFSEVSIEE